MTPENKQFLDDNRHHYDTLIKAFYLRGLSGETRQRMQDIMAKEFQPGYHTDLWCGNCVTEMVRSLYTHYDNWLAVQPVEAPAPIPPVEPEPVITKATFPSHKKHHRK